MGDKKNKLLVITAVITVGIFIVFMITPIIFTAINANKDSNNLPILNQTNNKTNLQENSGKNEAKYYTSSSGGNVDVGVIFMNPIQENTEELVFKVMLNTHSTDLSQYNKLYEYVELKTNAGIINKQLEWVSESNDSHHISGTLKVENDLSGNPILDEHTEYMKVVFKNIAGVKEREHVYTKETLK